MPGFVPIPRRMNFGRPSTTRIGPWPKGMVYRFVPENFGDQACQDIINFDVLPNGELKSRPTFVRGKQPIDYADAAVRAAVGSNSQWAYVGMFYNGGLPIGIFYNQNYIIASDLSGGSSGLLWKVTAPVGSTWGRPQLYQGKVYAVSLVDGTVYGYDQVTAASTTGAPAAASVSESLIFKDRMYVWAPGSSSRVYFSKTTAPSVMSGDPDSGYFDVNPGDGQTVQAIIATRNILYIFKDRSTYQLIVPPSGVPTQGTLSLIHPTIGTFSNLTVTVYENHVYTATQDAVYEVINGLFTNISYLIGPGPLFSLTSDRPVLSVIGDVLLVGNGASGVSNALVFNFKSRAWSRYKIATSLSADHFSSISASRVHPFRSSATAQITDVINNKYLQGGLICGRNGPYFYIYDYQYSQFQDTLASTALYGDYESSAGVGRGFMNCLMQTKDIDGGSTAGDDWKRYYAVNVNVYSADQNKNALNLDVAPNVQLALTDHNGNNVQDSAAILHDTAPDPYVTKNEYSAYDSLKFYTSLRARHIEYDITVVPTWGPISLYSLDVLVKVKAGEQTGQVGG